MLVDKMTTPKQRVIGSSELWHQVLQQASQVAPLNRPVLLVGERGTGKELIAERLHYLSLRWQQPYLQVNCAAMSENLLESELFGHEIGAFTGATRSRAGLFERADGGTLFLDELATASLPVQEKLLRVIEYGRFERVGGSKTLQVDVRVVAACNEDLPTLVEQGRFRGDLFDRLAFDVLNLPPLRYRKEDIAELAEHFALRMCLELGYDFFSGFAPPAQNARPARQYPLCDNAAVAGSAHQTPADQTSRRENAPVQPKLASLHYKPRPPAHRPATFYCHQRAQSGHIQSPAAVFPAPANWRWRVHLKTRYHHRRAQKAQPGCASPP
jgi:hypothetical protein